MKRLTSIMLLALLCGCGSGDSEKVIIADADAPTLVLIGDDPQQLELNEQYQELGASAWDERDGDLSQYINIDISQLNTQVAGTYLVNYQVQDQAGNVTTLDRQVIVLAVNENSPPQLSLFGSNPLTIVQGETYTEHGATSVDEEDGDISSSIEIDNSSVNTNVAGQYEVVYRVEDSKGVVTSVTRIVTVAAKPDNQLPTLSLLGQSPQILSQFETYIELGAEAIDPEDGEISQFVVIDASAVDTTTIGQYPVYYRVTDSGGGHVELIRWIQISPKTSCEINLTGMLENASPGDTITIPACHYAGLETVDLNKLQGTVDKPIVIQGEVDNQGNNLVTLDGSVEIDQLAVSPWQLVDGVWQITLSPERDIWQLFVEKYDSYSQSPYTQLVPARWPNAKFSDGSIYQRSAWARSSDTGHNPIMKHKDLKANSFGQSYDQLVADCLSPFQQQEDDWDLNQLQQTQVDWLLEQRYNLSDESFDKCVGISTDQPVSYKDKPTGSVTHDLASQSFDATGAMAVLNYGHWRTWARPVLKHKAGSSEFYHVFTPEFHGKNHYYYFEGAKSLLDTEEEWYFDKDSHQLYVKLRVDQDPNQLKIKAKIQSFTFDLNKAEHISFRNLNFFATTLRCTSCNHISIDQSNFEYGGASKRMLKTWANLVTRAGKLKLIDQVPDNIFISSSNGWESGDAGNYPSVNNQFTNSSIRNTDSPALHLNGKDSLVYNNHFENIDYSCAEGWPFQAAVNTYMGFDTDFRYNTFKNSACSQAFRGRDGSDVMFNLVNDSGWGQTDGALLSGGNRMAAAFNWLISHKELGMRFDAPFPPTAVSQWPKGSYAHHNVTMFNKGMVFKGWLHRIYNNTVVDQTYVDQVTAAPADPVVPRLVLHNDVGLVQKHNGETSEIYRCVGQPLEQQGCGAGVGNLVANNLTPLLLGNVGSKVERGDKITGVGGAILAELETNYEAFPELTDNNLTEEQQGKVSNLLRDTSNFDFRPVSSAVTKIGNGSDISDTSLFELSAQYSEYSGLPADVDYIGAYASQESFYWIPGKRFGKASFPIPVNQTEPANLVRKAKLDTDLMWRPAIEADHYLVYFERKLVGTYPNSQNVHFMSEQNLVSGQTYRWRVDVQIGDNTITGDTWQFVVE